MPNNLTDAEIKKALENHINFSKRAGSEYSTIIITKLENALDLINRYEARIKQLELKVEARNKVLQGKIAEIERLKKSNKMFTDIGKMYSEIKAEAYKEFAKLLCEDRVSNDPVVISAKCLLKELVGDSQ